MQQRLESAGYETVPFEEEADAYIVNTCTVTAIADQKTRKTLRRTKREHPKAFLIATGCFVDGMKEETEKELSLDAVLKNKDKSKILETVNRLFEEEAPFLDHKDEEIMELSLERPGEHTRAFLKIQDGCNQFCTYCKIPYVRGRVKSRRSERILEEAKILKENGLKEMILTGIHLGSYGMDRKEDMSLIELIEALDREVGVERLRLGSLEPRFLSEENVERLGRVKSLCPHFHLSLQSGSDGVLKRMNRHYTTEDFRQSVLHLRRVFDHPALTTDLIAGFPGETEEEFLEGYEFVKEMAFFETHVFPYSVREGTRAASMKPMVEKAVRAERAHKLLELSAVQREAYLSALIGREVELLVEEEENGRSFGHTREYLPCTAEGIYERNTLLKGVLRREGENLTLEKVLDI